MSASTSHPTPGDTPSPGDAPSSGAEQPVTITSWGPRRADGDAHRLQLLLGHAEESTGTVLDSTAIGEFTEEDKGHTVTATVYGELWSITRDDAAVTATLPDGRTFSLSSDKGRIAGAKRLNVDLAGRPVALVNEAKQDWVIEDATADETKLGQFSGGNRGVRSSLTQWEDGADVDDQQRAFLAYCVRVALESRLWFNTWILTASLLVLAPIIVLIYLYGPVFG